MSFWLRRSNNEPLFWLGQYPVYLTELLIGLHSVAFFIMAITSPMEYGRWIRDNLAFHSSDIISHGRAWELVTYIFVPAISLGFLLNMLSLYWFGRELEGHLGRKGFLFLYLCLAICPMMILAALNGILPTSIFFGPDILHFAVFMAFASLFPDAEIFFGHFQAKWVSLVLFAVYALISIANQEWNMLIVLVISSLIATFAVRAPIFSSFVEWMETHREEREAAEARAKRLRLESERQIHEKTIDDILDKISQHGMHSLTREERSTLERARANLLKKEKR